MHQLFLCKSCGNPIATAINDTITVKHRGRTITTKGILMITCEKCQTETRIEAKKVEKESVC